MVIEPTSLIKARGRGTLSYAEQTLQARGFKTQDYLRAAQLAQQQNKNLYSEEEVRNLLIECCGEVSCEDGALVGKSPEELVKWIDMKFKKK